MLNLNLQLEKLLEKIKELKAKTVLIQLPDGLKPKAKQIQEKIQEEVITKIKKDNSELKLTFWAGSCYGACDLPHVKDYDLFVQFGHSEWK